MRLKGLERLKENSGVEAKRHPVVPGRLRETRNELMNVVIGLFWNIQDGGTASGSVQEIAAAQPAEQAASFTPGRFRSSNRQRRRERDGETKVHLM